MTTKSREISSIQRLEMLEDKFGITLSGVNVVVTNDDDDSSYKIAIMGEIIATNGGSISESLRIKASVSDKSGKVIGTNDQWIDNDSFFGIDSLDISIYTHRDDISLVKIFPVKS